MKTSKQSNIPTEPNLPAWFYLSSQIQTYCFFTTIWFQNLIPELIGPLNHIPIWKVTPHLSCVAYVQYGRDS